MLGPKPLRQFAALGLLLCGAVIPVLAVATKSTKSSKTTKSSNPAPAKKSAVKAQTPANGKKVTKSGSSRRYRVRRVYNPWDTPTYADSTWGDSIDGEDLTVRRAAVQALGPYNGAVLVTDTNTGRILSIVNQR